MVDFDFENGIIYISDDLKLFPGFTFEEFRKTSFYSERDVAEHIRLSDRMPETQYVWLNEHIINDMEYLINLLFLGERLIMVTMTCWDKEQDIEDGLERKAIHDALLLKYGINIRKTYDWGEVESQHNLDNDLSSICFTYDYDITDYL